VENNRRKIVFQERYVVRHSGKVVLVTGGGSGIGRATALRFARDGASAVYVVDHFGDRADAVAAELRALGIKAGGISAELAELAGCHRAVDEVVTAEGRVDVVVSNAAAWTEEPFLEMKDESWCNVIGVNLTAYFRIGQRAAQAMVTAGTEGVILFTASISSLGASPEFAHYSAAKAGVANLTQTMAIELAQHRIRVNAVSPGPADTQQSVDLVGAELMDKWRREGFPVAPLNRLASADDVAGAFSYLASDDAAYVTGVHLVVDGGLTAHAYSVPTT
jgi:NAD(P)-dependent dehydrogenase (short-subunit alcohol dehydrogenase family)